MTIHCETKHSEALRYAFPFYQTRAARQNYNFKRSNSEVLNTSCTCLRYGVITPISATDTAMLSFLARWQQYCITWTASVGLNHEGLWPSRVSLPCIRRSKVSRWRPCAKTNYIFNWLLSYTSKCKTNKQKYLKNRNCNVTLYTNILICYKSFSMSNHHLYFMTMVLHICAKNIHLSSE